ncbi:MAG: [FeFe] hydrogenase H-cluster maturation GTPase HydF [Ruminococcus sp.]|nr:[FeFe] hydrogenase H-cluster maturation GTPase HydF [Ruminococcus sp.]
MEQTQNDTPRGNRLHIGFFGQRNAGKSSLVNAITGQKISIVSEMQGTTTDPVEKAMELLPIGAVVIIDTPGMDDTGILGQLRMERTMQILNHTDIAILVINATIGQTAEDTELLEQFRKRHISYLIVWNQIDRLPKEQVVPKEVIPVSATTGCGIDKLKESLIRCYQKNFQIKPERSLFGNLLKPEDLVILVTPIDESAPKGRIILPQVQAIRAALDKAAICLVTQPEQLAQTLQLLNQPPKLVVTDSQVFETVKEIIPSSIPLTSFSILFAHFKGVLQMAKKTVQVLDTLPNGSRILISEGCTHHRQCNDIGTIKLPKWIQSYTGKQFQFDFTSGNSFPNNLTPYALVVHCGGCMLNEREMISRAERAKTQCVPYTNYGVLIAYLNGIFQRSLSVLEIIDK